MKAKEKNILGWREFVSLPDLGVDAIKVKVDTGARTSSIHVSEIKLEKRRGKEYAHFVIHPKQRSALPEVEAKALVVEKRKVKSSSGHTTLRPVILTTLSINGLEREIELTLVNRDMMGFRMLLGREAIRGDFMVDPGKSYLMSASLKTKSFKRSEKVKRRSS